MALLARASRALFAAAAFGRRWPLAPAALDGARGGPPAVSHVLRRGVHSDDRYAPERELLSVPPGAEPEALQAGYMAAVAAAKATTQPALLAAKMAELGTALRTLTDAWTSSQLAGIGGQPLAGPASLQKESPSEVEASSRAHRALAAAKEYAAKRAGGASQGSSGGGGAVEPAAANTTPEWVQLGREISVTWQQALAGLAEAAGSPGGVTPAAEARFRGLVAAVNEEIERYNYLVPLSRFQQAKKSETVVDRELARARGQPPP